MTDADPVIDAEPRIRVTHGHVIAGIIGLTVGVTAGYIAGVFALPVEALSVPAEPAQVGPGMEPVFRPVPDAFAVNVAAPTVLGAIMCWIVYQHSRAAVEDEGEDQLENGGEEQ